jgi:hypothetical protein
MIKTIHRWMQKKINVSRYILFILLVLLAHLYSQALGYSNDYRKAQDLTNQHQDAIITADRFRYCIEGEYTNFTITNNRVQFDQKIHQCFDNFAPGISFSDPSNTAPKPWDN